MKQYDFTEQLDMSMQSLQLERDEKALKDYFPHAVSVRKTDTEADRSGIDYIVTLASGVEVGVDVKTRDKGCSAYWSNGPELALETWSQHWPKNMNQKNVVGWTVDDRKKCQYIMFKFDKSDSEAVYILPFQQLNKAFRRHAKEWGQRYRRARQYQSRAAYQSECLFVPADVVLDAVRAEFEVAV